MDQFFDTVANLRWDMIVTLGLTGIGMALLSCLVGMKQKVEMPAWWLLYAIWVVIVLMTGAPSPFWTILFASAIAGIVHGTTQSILIDSYIRNNPWYSDKMQGPKGKLRMMFIMMGIAIGIGFGALVGGIAWGIGLI